MRDGNGWDVLAALVMLLAFAFLVWLVMFMGTNK
jgi:hypothetical protein